MSQDPTIVFFSDTTPASDEIRKKLGQMNLEFTEIDEASWRDEGLDFPVTPVLLTEDARHDGFTAIWHHLAKGVSPIHSTPDSMQSETSL